MKKIKVNSNMTAKQAENAIKKAKKEGERLDMVAKAKKAVDALDKKK